MITNGDDPIRARVAQALATLEARSVRLAPARWLLDGSIVVSCESAPDPWLVFEGPAAQGHARSSWALLESNARLAWPAKVALGSGAREIVRADLALAEANGDLAERVRRSWQAVRLAGESVARSEDLFAGTRDEPDSGDRLSDASELAALCQASGWSVHPRDDGRVVVDLDVAAGRHQADITIGRAGVTCAFLELLRVASLPDECREAIGLVLLSVAGLVRAVRPAVSIDSDGRTSAGLETRIEGVPTRAALDRAFACLSIATELCAREVSASQSPSLASLFLSVQGIRSSQAVEREPSRATAGAPDSMP